MVSLLGPPPAEFLRRSEKCKQYWDEQGILLWRNFRPLILLEEEKRVSSSSHCLLTVADFFHGRQLERLRADSRSISRNAWMESQRWRQCAFFKVPTKNVALGAWGDRMRSSWRTTTSWCSHCWRRIVLLDWEHELLFQTILVDGENAESAGVLGCWRYQSQESFDLRIWMTWFHVYVL